MIGATALRPLLLAIGARIDVGSLTLELPDGTRHRFAGAQTDVESGPRAELRIRRWRGVRRLLLGGDIGFAEAFADGDVDSPDLTALIALAAHNEAALGRALEGHAAVRWLNRLRHLARDNSRQGSRRNIAAHYDLGNAFYREWLDPTLTYSSALFHQPAEPLESAQANKYRRIAAVSDVRAEHHLLEIGCGWGGFATYCAREIGCRVTAVTISAEQFAHVAAAVQAAGLGERVAVERRDYRDIGGRYDRIASIEMLEAVGERHWPVFFAKLREVLAPGGRAALQVITIADAQFEHYRRGADFIQRHIFPGGMLPSPAALLREESRAGLRRLDDHAFGLDYARTLALWRQRFQEAWDRIAPLGFDERFRRLWTFYLAYCEIGFRTGRIDVRQIALALP